jgi:hypothetical protein
MSDIKKFAASADLFNASIDDLADLPGFETPPAGSYVLEVSTDVKNLSGKDAVEASFTVVETVELDDAAGVPVANGTKFSTLFMLDNEFGVGNLKKFLAPFSAHFGEPNIGKLVGEVVKNVSISGLVKNRKDKADPEKVYGSVTNITVA